MILSQLIQRVRAARQGGAYPAHAIIWIDSGEDTAAKIAAERAAGRIGPSTVVCAVGWCEVDSANALPAPASSTEASMTTNNCAERIKALTRPQSPTGAAYV